VTSAPYVVTRDPATGHELQRYPAHDEAGVECALADASAAAATWAATPLKERLSLLRAVGALLTERRAAYAALITAEMGKPVTEALGEIDKCAWNCQVVADLGAGWLADRELASGASRSWLSYEPLGVVFAVMPWNFPFWQVLRFACASLVAGNAALLKHSPDVTGSALAIEELFADAGAHRSTRSRSADGSARARCSSTRRSPPTRDCRSAVPAAAATAASCPQKASASSPTSAP
jgi:succinate-semialdehyde dehydrogenase / glutarate-semialdehyde dehydrogenase